jgi:FtsH-binding integral membrane protein
MNSNELKSIGVSAGLVFANVILMALIALTPLSMITDILFSIPIVGMVIFGAGLMLGRYLAKKGLKEDNTGLAVIGAGLLELTYGIFGGGILSIVSTGSFALVLGLTAVVTTGIAVLAALLVYGTGRNFRSWGRYSNYLFMGAFGTGLIGSAFPPLLLLTFVLVLIGFIVYLVFEIWRMKQKPGRVLMNGIGIYIAYMGVFVEILQIIISLLADE